MSREIGLMQPGMTCGKDEIMIFDTHGNDSGLKQYDGTRIKHITPLDESKYDKL